MNAIAHELLTKAAAEACAARRQRLHAGLKSTNVDGLLLSCEKDIQYLTGFVGHESLGLVLREDAQTGGGGIIVSDSRYDEYLEPWRQQNAAEVVMGTRHRLFEAVREICQQRGIKRLGVQADHLTVAGRRKLAAIVGEERIIDTEGLVSGLRMIKDALEVQTILRAEGLAQDAIAAAIPQLTIGMTELEFSAVLEYEMKARGAHGSAFTPIIGSGPNSSIIHHSTGSTPIEPGVLLIDWGAMIDGYNSDLTRTFGIDQMPAKLRAAYAIVLEAQLAAIAAIKPGMICADIDKVARDIIARAGLGQYFGHGLGHGLGMDVHEGPYFNNLETETRLAPGMVMTVEPGVYIPGVGGVRIEDDILVTETGCRVLSDCPKDFDSALIETSLASTSTTGRR